MHVTCAFVLIALIAMHVGAAAFHGLVQRDGVVARMWPPVGAPELARVRCRS